MIRVCEFVDHTYRLQEYFGLTPSFAHASFSGVPSGISIFLLPDVSTVIRSEELLSMLDDDEVGNTTNASVNPSNSISSVDIVMRNVYLDIMLVN